MGFPQKAESPHARQQGMNVFPTLPGETSIPNTFHYLPLNIACAFDSVLLVMSKDAGCGGKKKENCLFITHTVMEGCLLK